MAKQYTRGEVREARRFARPRDAAKSGPLATTKGGSDQSTRSSTRAEMRFSLAARGAHFG